MNQFLPDIIRKNKDLQKVLLEQEGGIVSYLAGHLDADGLEALYKGYRTQCLEAYRDQNKWRMREEMIERGALGDNHIKKELAYQVALRPVLSGFPNVSEPALSFIADYMDYAFKKSHTELYPKNVVSDQKFYEEVIIQYSDKLFGRAHRCLWLVINEHRDKARAEKDVEQLWEEFELRKYARVYTNGVEKLRRAVNELINEKTQNKAKEETRQICREEAKDVMKRLRPFTRLVNEDDDILELHLKEEPSICEIWSSKDLELAGVSLNFIKRQKKYISKEEKVWLREGMLYVDPDSKDNEEMSPLQDCFQLYYSILNEIGDIWAVQLKEYGIDIRELEEETGCILNKRGFYVERSKGGLFNKICVIKKEDDGIEAKFKAIMEYVGRLEEAVNDEYVSIYNKMWDEILRLERVNNKVYEENHLPEGCIFKRNLVANIIHLMLEKGIFKVGINVPKLTLLLEPDSDKGKDHPVKEPLKYVPKDDILKNDVKNVIEKFINEEE